MHHDCLATLGAFLRNRAPTVQLFPWLLFLCIIVAVVAAFSCAGSRVSVVTAAAMIQIDPAVILGRGRMRTRCWGGVCLSS